MEQAELRKWMISIAVVLVIQLVGYLLKRLAKRTQKKYEIRQSRYFTLRRVISMTALWLSIIVLVLVWNVNIKHAWVSLTSVLALVAIAFFAVWSLIGNILAGVIIYFTSPFKIDDTIEVMPDEIRGMVLAINTFYTVLQTAEGDYINVPNSLFFQKYIQVVNSKNSIQANRVLPIPETD